jgi:hypothetical protein
MFQLHFPNFPNGGCSAEGETFRTLDEAIARGRALGFEFSVWFGDSLAASWTVFGGLRRVFP